MISLLLFRQALSAAFRFKSNGFSTISSLHAANNPLLVSIEGNIGSGKSTLMNYLRTSHGDYNYVEEPLATWNTIKDEKDRNLLEVYYSDPIRWSFTFQVCALLSRFQQLETAMQTQRAAGKLDSIFVSERCMDTDAKCFAKMLRAEGNISSLEMAIYDQYFAHVKATAPIRLGGIIYLRSTPEMCAERIRRRSRKGEDLISLDYLTKLDRFTAAFVQGAGVPVLTVDAAEDTSRVLIQEFVEGLTRGV
jgi:deoxyadenosine/deoxycytidine kinase